MEVSFLSLVIKLCPLTLQVFKKERYLNDAYQCADVIWQYGLLKKGYGLCHGAAGNAYGLPVAAQPHGGCEVPVQGL